MSEEHYDPLLELLEKFPAAADYLSTIVLIQRDYGEVHNSQLALRLGVSKPAVTQAISRLKKLKLIKAQGSGTICLTEQGHEWGNKIITRHYLVEHLLIKNNYPWDKADEEAQRLQAVISQDLADHLFESFGHPQICPHGNPFPGSKAEHMLISAPRLITLKRGESFRLLRITEEGEGIVGLLKFCHQKNIHPGLELSVIDNLEDLCVHLQDLEGQSITIPWSFACHICIEIITK
ncbi:MAG: metal-dependent transcriptional regulator [Spirochaetales bacterium]|nr:metal-dependent transcriptional regulator [Spirochaetales bacterium]